MKIRVSRVATTTLLLLLATVPAIATAQAPSNTVPPACPITAIDSSKVKEITDKYAGALAVLRENAKAGAKKIEDETPDGGAETTVGVDGHVEQRRVDFSFDIPEVTMREQKVAIDLPEIAMKTQSWSYDSVRVVTSQDCRQGPDETVWEDKTCHNDWPPFDYSCGELRTRRGADICLPTIKVEPYREEIKLDVPETRMARQEWILNVPEFKMVTQKFAFDYPVLIVDDVQTKTAEQKKEAQDLGQRTSEAGQRITTAMKGELRNISVKPIEIAFQCQSSQMRSNMRIAFDKLTQLNAATAAGYEKAKEIKSPEAIASYGAALAKMNTSKEQMLKNYVQIRRDLMKKKREALAKLQ